MRGRVPVRNLAGDRADNASTPGKLTFSEFTIAYHL
jgi:hypothetical protein